MNIKKNFTLIIGIAIPLLMILLVAAAIYLPRFFVHPEYDFLYASSGDYYGLQEYSVRNGKLVKQEVARPENQIKPPEETKLFIHDVDRNESREASFEDARDLELDSRIKSPDGFEIQSGGSGDGFFPFFSTSGDYKSRYLVGRNVSIKLDLESGANSNYGSFRFLGWIR